MENNKIQKTILLSVKPKFLADILNGKKTIEIRKKIPMNEYFPDYGYRVLLYCTKSNLKLYKTNGGYETENNNKIEKTKDRKVLNGKVVGEFTVTISPKEYEAEWYKKENCLMDIKELTLDDNEPWDENYVSKKVIYTNEDSEDKTIDKIKLLKDACLSFDKLGDYLGEGIHRFYGIKIDNLLIYEKPKDLADLNVLKAPQNYLNVSIEFSKYSETEHE